MRDCSSFHFAEMSAAVIPDGVVPLAKCILILRSQLDGKLAKLWNGKIAQFVFDCGRSARYQGFQLFPAPMPTGSRACPQGRRCSKPANEKYAFASKADIALFSGMSVGRSRSHSWRFAGSLRSSLCRVYEMISGRPYWALGWIDSEVRNFGGFGRQFERPQCECVGTVAEVNRAAL